MPTYVKDEQHVLDETANLTLPPNAKLFTCDYNSMYNNIDTDHAIILTEIAWWLNDLHNKKLLPLNSPLEVVIRAMKAIMRNSIFEYGDLNFLQLLGTAMGISSVVMWATLYYAYHEVHTLLPKYGTNLPHFKWFIVPWWYLQSIVGDPLATWSDFCNDIYNVGVLTWDIHDQRLSTLVDFLDLTLTIEGAKITSRTFQKRWTFISTSCQNQHTLQAVLKALYTDSFAVILHKTNTGMIMFNSSHFFTNASSQEDGKEVFFGQKFYTLATKLNTKASTVPPLLTLEMTTTTAASYTFSFAQMIFQDAEYKWSTNTI